MNHPVGTLTFLFTDIEGSTERWEKFPDAMRLALLRHDSLLREIIEHHHGYIFKTIGDAFCAAFSDPCESLQAALAIQYGLQNETWDAQIGQLKVRIALYTGQAEAREGDYVGPILNRVARLLGAGHGGQVLLARPTYQVVEQCLSDGVTLRGLGERRLKDLLQPETIYQLVAPGLPAEFPPLRTLEVAPVNLPAQSTSFVGREQELAKVRELLRQPPVRLVSLTGPGGTGKTRLSLQVAADLAAEFAQGVYFVALGALREPELVLPAIAQALGLKESQPQSLTDNLKEFLQNKQLLLVLDNFEQVMAAASRVSDLLRAAPSLKILVSSRERLHIYGEHEYPVPPLAQPDPTALTHLAPGALMSYEAVRLFVERTRSVRPGFMLIGQNAPVVAQICRRLDGLPLAIELAAARCKLFTPEVLLARLDQRLRILTGGAVNLPPRQQTLRGAIDWSYELLSEAEKRLFARLGVFIEGCAFEAAEVVCHPPAETDWDTLEGLESLVDKSLLRLVETEAGAPRFVMLETLREYALERLQTDSTGEQTRRRFLDYYLQLADEARPHLQSAEQANWFNRLAQEHGNLRAALEQTRLLPGGEEIALQIAVTLRYFWAVRGFLSEGRALLAQLLTQTLALHDTLIYLKVVDGAGSLARLQGDFQAALELHRQGLEIARRLGDDRAIARSYYYLGIVSVYLHDYEPARQNLDQSLTISRQITDRSCEALALNGLGNLALEEQLFDQAREAYNTSLALNRELGDKRGIAGALNNLGLVEMHQGRLVQATSVYAESVALNRELGDKYGTALALNNLGLALLQQEQFAAAEAALEESLLLGRAVGNRAALAGTLTTLAGLYAQRDHGDRALALLRESLQLNYDLNNLEGMLENLTELIFLFAPLEPLRAARLYGFSLQLAATVGLATDELPPSPLDLDDPALQAEIEQGRSLLLPHGLLYALNLS